MMTTRSFLIAATALVAIAATGMAMAHGSRGDGFARPGQGERFAARGEDRAGRGGAGRGGLQMFERAAEQFDTDGDGTLTQAEVDAARAAQLAEFDADGDGVLSLAEYEALWLDAMRERMVDRFQSHDDDGDGLVTAEEFAAPFADLIRRRDRNGDGAISAEDFARIDRRGPARGEAPEAE